MHRTVHRDEILWLIRLQLPNFTTSPKRGNLHPVPYILVTSNLSIISNFRSGFLDFGFFASRSRRSLRSRRLLSSLLRSSSASRGFPFRDITEESEFLRILRGSCFFGDSTGSAKTSNSPAGRGLLEDDPAAILRARMASSCDRDGRCPGGPRGGTFSGRAADEYGGSVLSPDCD